ncbi:Ig-like domain repeat protein [Silvibacterium dinghuense]|nr:Ig-like domain repeat protein [Silvibacterium dinghuense]GGG92460.1 hypothetical protein GCM10011586_03940 [Silvibacterium dinghuense]
MVATMWSLCRRAARVASPILTLPLVLIGLADVSPAQTTAAVAAQPSVRLTQPIVDSQLVTLKHTVHPLANAANDRGAVSDSLGLDRIQVVLKRSDAQEAALKQLIGQMHTKGSASYHKWLTPEQFGAQFGPSDQDIATVEAWLQAKGFSVSKVNPGKLTIEMSGNAGQFRSAFHTQIHKYVVNGETHYANATDPQIPAALAPVFGGFVSINNFRPKNQAKLLGKASYDPKTDKATPQWTIGSSSTGYNFVVAPGDFAVQYDLNPLYSAGINGSGQTIGIINDSNINVGLVNQFRTLFGLSANPPQVVIDGNDPGVDGTNNPDGPNYDSVEAYLDVEWAGAVAPQATVDLVIAADTALESGLYLAAEHAVYANVAPVLSLSFGECEAGLGSTNAFFNDLWEQAAAQGITVMVSSGDAGSAACDNDNSQYYAVDGQAVNGFASTPYNVAVGGTDFYYSDYATGGASITNYWSLTPSNSTPAVSLQSTIPEQPWNASQYGLNLLDYYSAYGVTTIAGGGGGASNAAVCSTSYDSSGTCTGTLSGYTKPSWQTGTGVPSDKVRDVPDVSLFASSGANYSYYAECYQDGDCQTGGSSVQITGIGGTSASSPAFAGIMALVNQKYGRQGQADFVLYPLATQYAASFHDVQNGSNSEPCNTTTVTISGYSYTPTNCISVSNPISIDYFDSSTAAATTEGQIGSGTTAEYNAGTGYDLASGLGSVDAYKLVTNWGNVTFAGTTTTLTPSSASFTHGTAVTISGTVTASSGTPSGSVALMTNNTDTAQQGQTNFTLSSGSYSGSVNFLPGGTYDIWGQYSGDGTNGASTSEKTQITVTPESSGVYLMVLTPYGSSYAIENSGTTGIPYGTQLLLEGLVAPSSELTAEENCITGASSTCPNFGVPTGTVAFSDGGTLINTAVLNASGEAEYKSAYSVGSHSITSSYSGDQSYKASTASAVTFSVVKNSPNAYIAGATLSAASSGSFTFVQGQPTTFYVLLENSASVTSEAAAPTGSVALSSSPSLGTASSASLVAGVDPSTGAPDGIATFTIPATAAAGTYTITASYAGDTNYSATGSLSAQIVLTAASGSKSSSISATASASATSPNAAVEVSGTVTGQTGSAAPTGTVDFYSAGTNLGSVSLSAPSSGDVSSFAVDLTSQLLLQGSNPITLQYSGDSNYKPSSTIVTISNPLSDFSMVPQAVNIPLAAGGSATDTINVSSVNGFSGAVNFTCTASTVTCSVTSSATLSSGGSSALTLTVNAGSSVTAGSYNVLITGTDSTGEYVHTLGLTAIVSGTASTGSFSLSASPTTLTVAPGATTNNTSQISVTPSGGFTGTVSLSCAVTTSMSNVTDTPTCSIASSATISTSGATTAVLTVSTTAATSSAVTHPLDRLFAVGGGIAVAGLLMLTIPARRRSWRTMLGVFVFAALVSLGIGCGSGGNSGGGGGSGGTTAGSYTVTVTGTTGTSGSITQTTTVSVTVS